MTFGIRQNVKSSPPGDSCVFGFVCVTLNSNTLFRSGWHHCFLKEHWCYDFLARLKMTLTALYCCYIKTLFTPKGTFCVHMRSQGPGRPFSNKMTMLTVLDSLIEAHNVINAVLKHGLYAAFGIISHQELYMWSAWLLACSAFGFQPILMGEVRGDKSKYWCTFCSLSVHLEPQ